MSPETETAWVRSTIDSQTLVKRLRDPHDEAAWGLVADRYGPLIELFARQMGLPQALAEDARQETLLAFAQAVRAGRYDDNQGRLRDFLFGIAKHRICDVIRREIQRQQRVGSQAGRTSFFLKVPGDDEFEKAWAAEARLAVANQCLCEAREHFSAETYAMFFGHAIEGRPSAEVAAALGKTPAAVDMATHNVRAFLRQIHPEMEEVY